MVGLYDRFAHAFDPNDPGADDAERAFEAELTSCYDDLPEGLKPPLSPGTSKPATSGHFQTSQTTFITLKGKVEFSFSNQPITSTCMG